MMPIQTMISKFTIKTNLLAFAFLLFSTITFAQKKQKVDGVAAVVGNYIVLDSDIDLMLLELKTQGTDITNISRCELLGKQLEDKLYAHQAVQDSIVVTDEEINSFMDSQMNTMVEQIGSKEKLFEYYKKKDEEDFRSYFFEIIKLNKLTSQMQRKIVDEITVTPDEVKQFFNKIPADQIPTIGAEIWPMGRHSPRQRPFGFWHPSLTGLGSSLSNGIGARTTLDEPRQPCLHAGRQCSVWPCTWLEGFGHSSLCCQ